MDVRNKNFKMSQCSSDLLHIIYNCIPRSFMEIYSHFLYTWKTKKKNFLIDAHTNTGVRIYWHARFRQKLVIFLQGVSAMRTIKVLIFRVDEFVNFNKFDEKFRVHTKWMNGRKISLIPTLMITIGKIYISAVCSFCIDVYFSILLFRYQQFTTTYSSFYSTHIPDKLIEFN